MGFHHKMTTQESAKSIISNQSIESNATYTCTCGISSNSSGNITKNRDAKNLMENSCSHKNNILNFKNHNRGKLVKQIFLYLLGILSFIPCGASIGWSSNYLFGHWNNSQFLHSSTSWIVASLPFSAAFTSLSLVKLFRKLGIRVLLFASTTIMSLSWTFILIESYHSSILLIGRILNGIGIATIFTIIPIYLQDLMPTKHRKRIGNVMYAATIVGVLLEYINDFYPTKNSSTILMIIISILPTIGFIFFPESPQSLVRNQNYVDARNILEQFIPNENCDEIIGKMQNWTIAEQRDDEKFAVVFRNRSWIERLIPLFGLVIFDTLLSVTVILFYLKPIVFALGELNSIFILILTLKVGVFCVN
uniref:CSON012404 protein n=1 Tax=Culicoides sonorensis TaxID=179676 RepID=A0A336M5F1_CULSO